MNDKQILYLGMEVKPEDKNIILSKFTDYINEHMDGNYKLLCHHMTIAFHTNMPDNILNWVYQNENKEFEYTLTAIGYSDKAIACIINTEIPSTNNLKHITLAININNNGKPVDSNYIVNWDEITPLTFNGIIKIYTK